jgi:hypothetical protein
MSQHVKGFAAIVMTGLKESGELSQEGLSC